MSVGMIATVALLPPKLVDAKFFGSVGFWAALFTGIGLFVRRKSVFHLSEIFGGSVVNPDLVQWTWILFLVFFVVCIALWLRMRLRPVPPSRPELFVIAAVGLAAVVLDSLQFRAAFPPAWAQNVLLPLNFVTTSFLLGGFLAGMMFGHHYLMNTDIPKKLLLTMAWILVGIMALRIVAVGATLVLFKGVVRPDVNFLDSLVSLQGHGIFFWQRILVGLFIPAIVVGLIWGTARIGSNQSATGIMYVAIAFVFIGELVARYLFLLSGIPL